MKIPPYDTIIWLWLKRACQVTALLFLASVVWVALYAVVPVPFTPLMVMRTGEAFVDGKGKWWTHDWVPLRAISPRLQAAVIAAEDARFYFHHGFDFDAIDKAVQYNRRHVRRMRGASTISQQVAKNVFLWPARNWVRKGCEVYFTALIELFWSKRRILEVYLNVVEFGDGVYGAEAAARAYFHKPAVRLGTPEAALLAAVLPNPRRFSVVRPSGYVRFRQGMIQRRMYRL